jgi:PknH-like extracellular domain
LFRYAVAVLAAGTVLAGCSSGATATHPSTPKPVPPSALAGLLAGVADVSAVMGTAMTPHPSFTTMSDHRDLLPNLNCLGIWGVTEHAVYATSGFTGIQGQVLRSPDSDNWNSRVVQAVVSYLSPDAARKFFADSADRWSHCTNHRVHMTSTGNPDIYLTFGSLTRTDTELTIPLSVGGSPPCQRALAVDNNLIIDVAACAQTISDQASSIVSKIEARIPA